MNVVALANSRPAVEGVHHLFRKVRVYTGSLELDQRATIDSGSPFNLISQRIIKRYSVAGDDHDIPQARNLNRGGIRLFQRHRVAVETKRTDGFLNPGRDRCIRCQHHRV